MLPSIQANAVIKYKRMKFFHVLIPFIFIQTSQFKIRDAEKSPVKPIAAVVMNSCQAFGTMKIWFCGNAQNMKQLFNKAKTTPVPPDKRYRMEISEQNPHFNGLAYFDWINIRKISQIGGIDGK